MKKKLKKDFRERQTAGFEREMLHSKTDAIPEESKLKHNDDYRGKIIHDKERFQDKIHQKISKVKSDNKQVEGNSKRNAKYRAFDKESVNETGAADYDSLGQDLDNDGIIDRYDNDFRDSDYFESTYDVDDNLQNKEKSLENSSKNHKAQKSKYKRKNYSDDLYTRKKDNVEKDGKPESEKVGKEIILDREKKNRLSKEQKTAFNNKTTKVSVLSGLAKGSETVRDYLSHGSDENQGVEAGEKTADASSKLIHGIKRYSDKKRTKKGYDLAKKDYKIRKRKSKLEFRDAKAELKKTDEYKRASAFKKFQKRKQMKAGILKQNKSRLRDRIKESFISTLKSSKEMIIRKAKGTVLALVAVLIVGTFIINFAGTAMSGAANSTSSVLSTSYLSNPDVLTEVNQHFSGLEEGLQDELDSVETNYPGYDEYIVEKEGEIGHNTHELLSYLTSRYGVMKELSEVQSIINDLFKKMYRLSYKEEVEIRYRTVTETYTDENGNEYTESHEEAYEYKKLIVTLHKKEMDSVIREILADYPDNITHYEALLATQGNMGNVFGSGNGNLSEIVNNPDFSNPGIAFDDATVQALFREAESHIGKRYVFGANGPSNFDCSSFVCFSFTHSEVKNMPRTTAYRIYTDYCNPVSPSEAKAGDIIFFKNTYNSGSPISHVGIYAGGGMMLHAGDPIRFTSIDTPYWREHFYGFGRVKN